MFMILPRINKDETKISALFKTQNIPINVYNRCTNFPYCMGRLMLLLSA